MCKKIAGKNKLSGTKVQVGAQDSRNINRCYMQSAKERTNKNLVYNNYAQILYANTIYLD